MPKPLVSVIVLNHNGVLYLGKCLKSIQSQTYADFEVIVVDNASSDGSVQYVRENFPSVRIIGNDGNLGYALANNEAAKLASGDYMLFLNVDTWVRPDLLERLVSKVSSDSRIGVCACTQLSYDAMVTLNSGLTADLLSYPSGQTTSEILYADGASLFVSKSIFVSLGGFDSA